MINDASLICHVNLANGFRGGERQTMLLIEALSQEGYKQRLIARKGSELSARCQSISQLDILETSFLAFDSFSNSEDNIFFHFHESRSFPAFYLYGLFKNLNYIYTRRVQRPPKNNFISNKIYREAKNIVCLSSSIAYSVKNSIGKDLELKIIPSASANFTHDREKSMKIRRAIKQNFIVGHIGELDDSHKGQMDIIEIAIEAKNKDLNIGFILVGSGKDELMLKRACKDLDNVYFAGQVENVGDYLDAFDIFIFPSRHEGLGSTLLDAMDFGLPIIARNIGGIKDIIENNLNGYMLDTKNLSEIMPKLEILSLDKELLEKFSKENKLKASKYSISKMTNSYIELYKTR